ncbi:MAG: hypothetical protein ABJA71_06425 [Ginsengibacter sp.]
MAKGLPRKKPDWKIEQGSVSDASAFALTILAIERKLRKMKILVTNESSKKHVKYLPNMLWEIAKRSSQPKQMLKVINQCSKLFLYVGGVLHWVACVLVFHNFCLLKIIISVV